MLVMVHRQPASGYIRIRNKYALGRDKHSERQICPEIVCEAQCVQQFAGNMGEFATAPFW